MNLAPDISFHPFGDRVYVHSADTQRDFILDGSASDVLEFFSTHPDSTVDDLCACLAELYSLDASELADDMRDFVSTLIAENIIADGEPLRAEWSGEIAREVSDYYARHRRLFAATLELTYRCCERCVHCYIDDFNPTDARAELSVDEWRDTLTGLRSMGCVKILLTGGEVLMRSDFCDIVEHASGLGFIVDIYTAGLGLTDEIFDRIVAAKVNSVSFSLYGGSADTHDRITGVRGSFDRTLSAMMMFNCAGVCTFIKSVAIKQNFDALESLCRLARRLRIRLSISPRIVSGHQSKRADDYRLSADQYKSFFESDARRRSDNFRPSPPISREELLQSAPCSAGLNGLAIDPYGNVRACAAFRRPLGSLRTETLETLWARAGKQSYLKNFRIGALTPRCRNCNYVEHCQICVAELLDGDDPNDCGDVYIRACAAAHAQRSNTERR